MRLFLAKLYTLLFTLDREPMTDQSKDTILVHLGEPMSFIGVIYIQVHKWGVTGKEMTKTDVPPKLTPIPVTAAAKSGTWKTLHICRFFPVTQLI